MDERYMELMDAALRAAEKAEVQHGSKWTRAALVALAVARMEVVYDRAAIDRATDPDPRQVGPCSAWN